MTSSQDNYTPPLLPSCEAGISAWSANNEHRPFRNESRQYISQCLGSKVTIQAKPQILGGQTKVLRGG